MRVFFHGELKHRVLLAETFNRASRWRQSLLILGRIITRTVINRLFTADELREADHNER